MLRNIRLKFGQSPDAQPVVFTPGAMTVIVGPNNSGKSLFLQELDRRLYRSENDWSAKDAKILADVEPSLPATGPLRESVLQAVRADLAELRADDGRADAQLRAILGFSGKNLPEPLARQARYWLGFLDKRNAVLTLLNKGRLRTPPEMAAPGAEFPLEKLLQEDSPEQGIRSLVEWFKGESRPHLELVRLVNERSEEALIADGIVDLRGYFEKFRKQCMLLDGKARLELDGRERGESLLVEPEGTVMRLWHDRDALARLRRIVHDAFGLHLCIHLLDLGSAHLVLADRPPPPNLEDRLDREARDFLASARPLGEFSDGVRSYIGLHAELVAQDRRVVMIDEPEAFLHPPLARRLGFNLGTLAAERDSCVFAATHSPDFLMGCVESGRGVNIVRLGYRNQRPTAHLLPRDELQAMMVDPLLRSTGVLGALFHQAAVVVEGDSDRTFYAEINERLRLHQPADHPPVMRDCVFLNAQGKGTVSRVLAALRRAGVASCGVVDLDLLKDKKVCTNLLRAGGAPESVWEAIGYTRSKVQSSVVDLAAKCAANGLAAATSDELKGIRHFIREMEDHGIFLPEVGVVEGWLADLGVEARKSHWIPRIFQAMGPVDTGLKPGSGDVWKFLRRIGRYLEDLHTPPAPTYSPGEPDTPG